ncbi:hypothetical protein M413DRAFT_448987 [Hebeloma cylindrosporum]|uniref:Uncharacterized protein n=1 Tax=Hebeloma cylindrosporum TaxID=76867 RepID=A0A0C2XFF5_HEBCY|nr:hypothetical protein M413DRAFT_448987 [Hebeloma cylindrosporum h7]
MGVAQGISIPLVCAYGAMNFSRYGAICNKHKISEPIEGVDFTVLPVLKKIEQGDAFTGT